MRTFRVPNSRDIFADVPVDFGEMLGEGVDVVRPGDPLYDELDPWATEDAPEELWPLIREIYAARRIEPSPR